MRRALTVLALAAPTPVAASSQAAPVYYRAVASGPAEEIPNGLPGSSVPSVEIDDLILRAALPFRALSSPAVSAHLHCCTVDAFRGAAPIPGSGD